MMEKTDQSQQHPQQPTFDVKIVGWNIGRHVNEHVYAQNLLEEKSSRIYGNPPEAHDGIFSRAGDMWTVGAVAYKLLTGDLSR